MPSSQSLMTVATNSDLRIFERIKIIKGDDKKISSPEEAKAILAIPTSEVVWSDNKNELPYAQIEAKNYLQFGDSNLWDSIKKAGKYIKNKGILAFDRISQYFRNEQPVAQNSK